MITISGISFVWVPSQQPHLHPTNSVTIKVKDLVSKAASQPSTPFGLPSTAATHGHDSDTDSDDLNGIGDIDNVVSDTESEGTDKDLEDTSSAPQRFVTKKRKRTADAASTPEEQLPPKPKRLKKTPVQGTCLDWSCSATVSSDWRLGPRGAKTLCNACGIHYSKFVQRMLKTPDSDTTQCIAINRLLEDANSPARLPFDQRWKHIKVTIKKPK